MTNVFKNTAQYANDLVARCGGNVAAAIKLIRDNIDDRGLFNGLPGTRTFIQDVLAILEAPEAPEPTLATVEDLKAEGRYHEAGALAFSLKFSASYGCHYGLRRDLEKAREEYRQGWQAAKAKAEAPEAPVTHEEIADLNVRVGGHKTGVLSPLKNHLHILAQANDMSERQVLEALKAGETLSNHRPDCPYVYILDQEAPEAPAEEQAPDFVVDEELEGLMVRRAPLTGHLLSADLTLTPYIVGLIAVARNLTPRQVLNGLLAGQEMRSNVWSYRLVTQDGPQAPNGSDEQAQDLADQAEAFQARVDAVGFEQATLEALGDNPTEADVAGKTLSIYEPRFNKTTTQALTLAHLNTAWRYGDADLTTPWEVLEHLESENPIEMASGAVWTVSSILGHPGAPYGQAQADAQYAEDLGAVADELQEAEADDEWRRLAKGQQAFRRGWDAQDSLWRKTTLQIAKDAVRLQRDVIAQAVAA